MPNTREKLIELVCSTEYGNGSLIGNNFQKGFIEKIADHLIANGVTVLAEPKTNADRIRAMSDEELAPLLIEYRDDWGDYVTYNCEFFDEYEEAKTATMEWLKQPVEGE